MGKTTSVRPAPPTPVMAIEAASVDAELASYLEVLADLDELRRVTAAKLFALESLLPDPPARSLASALASCLRIGCLVRDRLHAATDTPGAALQLVPSLDMMLLEAIRGAYRWSIQGFDRVCQLVKLFPSGFDERVDPGAPLRALAEIQVLCRCARDTSQARALSIGLDAVADAIRAFADSIERIEREAATAASTQP
jgi:hypothetical protein